MSTGGGLSALTSETTPCRATARALRRRENPRRRLARRPSRAARTAATGKILPVDKFMRVSRDIQGRLALTSSCGAARAAEEWGDGRVGRQSRPRHRARASRGDRSGAGPGDDAAQPDQGEIRALVPRAQRSERSRTDRARAGAGRVRARTGAAAGAPRRRQGALPEELRASEGLVLAPSP